MFRSATLRLTAWYLSMIMLLSIGFSMVLYTISSRELTNTLRHQTIVFERTYGPFDSMSAFDQSREGQLLSAQEDLRGNLYAFNFFMLLAGGGASYFLARRSLKPLEEAMIAQKRFTGDASHELRTPLTAMQAEIEVALRDKALHLKDAKELLQSNLEEVQKLQKLSNNLLLLSQYDTDALPLEPIPLSEVLSDALKHTRPLAAAKHITITNAASDLLIQGDAISLSQLFTIILDNAIKYSPKDSTITLSSHQKGGHVFISVQDQGYGINPKDIPHIFERLYRAEQSRTNSSSEGYGLGLSIAKKIVELHQGEITVESTPKQGSTFTVRLPFNQK